MKLLHLTSGKLFGGVESMLLTLARERAHAPELSQVFAACFSGKLTSELERAGLSPLLLGEVRISRPWTLVGARRRLRQLIQREAPDVVVCHGAWTHVVFGPVVRRAGALLCLFQHDVPNERHWLDRWASSTAPDLLIANSNFTQRRAERLFPGVLSEVYHCPISPSEAITSDERLKLRAELGVRPDQVVVIQVCRLDPLKGHRAHLAALAEFRERPEWISVQVGGPQRQQDQSYLEDLQRFAVELGIRDRVRFLGQRPDARRLLAASDIHLQPNEQPEGYGVVFVEAMLASLPVLTFRLGALPEIVGDGEGLLVDSPAELVEKLGLLLADPALRGRLGENARRRAVALSDPAIQLPALKRLLTAALKGRRSALRRQ